MTPHIIAPDAIASCRCKSNPVVHDITPKESRRVGVSGNTRNGHRDTRCPSARSLAMVREDTGARSESAAYVWTAANEAVGSTRACRMM
ncbi:hypothetical protein TNCV_2973361 [Trichonephila clavipes]|nr:hypothetical protein TNCV_2973361 [Trichonephila clavipes]